MNNSIGINFPTNLENYYEAMEDNGYDLEIITESVAEVIDSTVLDYYGMSANVTATAHNKICDLYHEAM